MNNPDKITLTSDRPEPSLAGSADFLAELDRFGPDRAGQKRFSVEEARNYCRNLACQHYENFPVVSRLLPKRLHQHFYNIYAYCRWADDLGDEVAGANTSLRLLDWWQEELNDCYAGRAEHPVFIALEETIATFSIPRNPFVHLITAFKQDQHLTEYDSFEQLLGYCQNSANPVGRLVLYLCESASDTNFELSDSACTGLQLANFWQDVRRDFEIGRIYLPREDRDRFGVTRETIAAGASTPEFRDLIEFQVKRARGYLTSGLPLIQRVPRDVRLDIDLFIQGGLAILQTIENANFRILERRPKLSKWRFLQLFFRSWYRAKLGGYRSDVRTTVDTTEANS